MKEKTRVLFICIHNSGRSQMAETFLKAIGGERFGVESAGLEPRPVNPYVIEVMKEMGYDLSDNTSDSVMQCICRCNVFLAEAAGDIIFGLFFPGIGEHSLGVIKFNEFTQI